MSNIQFSHQHWVYWSYIVQRYYAQKMSCLTTATLFNNNMSISLPQNIISKSKCNSTMYTSTLLPICIHVRQVKLVVTSKNDDN